MVFRSFGYEVIDYDSNGNDNRGTSPVKQVAQDVERCRARWRRDYDGQQHLLLAGVALNTDDFSRDGDADFHCGMMANVSLRMVGFALAHLRRSSALVCGRCINSWMRRLGPFIGYFFGAFFIVRGLRWLNLVIVYSDMVP